MSIFCPKEPLPRWIDKKDYMWINLTKRTPSAVAAGAAGDTWHLPPRQEAAGPAATAGGGRAVHNGCGTVQRNGWGQVGHAATGWGGRCCPCRAQADNSIFTGSEARARPPPGEAAARMRPDSPWRRWFLRRWFLWQRPDGANLDGLLQRVISADAL